MKDKKFVNELHRFLLEFNQENHTLSRWAKEHGIGFEGSTSHAKRLVLASLVLNLAGPLMREPVRDTLIYETGFNTGTSATAICEALEITGSGRLVAFELDEKKKPIAEQFVARFPRTEFVWGDSGTTLSGYLERDAGKVSLFHQDGIHNIEGTKKDILSALTLLHPGGLLVVDDANTDVVRTAVRETIGEGRGLWLLNQTGQFVYQKR